VTNDTPVFRAAPVTGFLPAHRRPSWSATIALLCLASAVAVSVIYLPQAMLTELALNLGVPTAAASVVASAVQIGYAVGMFFLIPLADSVHPRRQITIESVLLVIALLLAAAMPEIVGVILSFFVVGLVANIGQIILPTANKLAPVGKAGATTGALVGTILIGIFGGRLIASVLVDVVGWRWVVVLFAVLVLATIPLSRWVLNVPVPLGSSQVRYGALLLATIRRVRTSPILVQSTAIQFFVFASFNSFWTVMVLHLTGPAYGWSVAGAGLFGLVGLAAGLATPYLARSIDRFGPVAVAGVLLGVMMVASLAVAIDSDRIVLFGFTMFVATLANQLIQSANQTRALAANRDAAAQANTLFMVGMFAGGSTGVLLGPVMFGIGGMPAVALEVSVLLAIALLIWVGSAVAHRRSSLAKVS
jgi:predicted MFS family arabinose efflux permease